jgi:hypothetical protein
MNMSPGERSLFAKMHEPWRHASSMPWANPFLVFERKQPPRLSVETEFERFMRGSHFG